jgi:3-hydroxyanthranilate 3,4-dioxygenase
MLRLHVPHHRTKVRLNNVFDDMPPSYDAFYADEDARTCGNCVALHPGKPPGVGADV